MEWVFPQTSPGSRLLPPCQEALFTHQLSLGPEMKMCDVWSSGCSAMGDQATSILPVMEGTEGACARGIRPESAALAGLGLAGSLFLGDHQFLSLKIFLVFNVKVLDHHGISVFSFFQTPLVSAGEAGRCDKSLSTTAALFCFC